MGGGRDFPGHRGGRSGGGRGRGRGSYGGRGFGGRGHSGDRADVGAAMDLPAVLYNEYPFRTGVDGRYDMARFVRAAADCDATLLNEFLLRLGHTHAVLDKLRTVASARISVADRTFQDVALPLLTLLSSRTFLDSIHATDVKRVLRVVLVGEPLFLRRVRSCLDHEAATLRAQGLLTTSADAVAGVLHALVRKLPDSAQDDDVFALICDVREWVHTCEFADRLAAAAAVLDDALEMCVELVPARRAVLHPQTTDTAVDYLIRDVRTGLSLRTADATAPRTDAFAQGPRHDNDTIGFRDVQVIPTDLEMRCVEPAYLPTRGQLLAAVDEDAGAVMERHLDFHYRLLREDVLAQMRRGIQWALRPATLNASLRTQRWKPPREANVPMLNVALDARLDQLSGSIHKGVMFQISAKQPASVRNKSKAKRREFWERERQYERGSLVCIAVGVTHAALGDDDADLDEEERDDQFPRYAALGARELIFATVADKDPANLYSDPERFSVKLALLDTNHAAELVTVLTNPTLFNLLIEVRGLFFTGYKPILSSLQQLDARALGSDLQQCLYGGDRQAAYQRKPEYARPLATYDLQFLVCKDADVRVDLRSVPGEDYATLLQHLRAYEQRGVLVLDASQCEAFAAAMTQQVCLIQGPPGTGKSYVGTKIVRGILNQPVEPGPILCVCYTNHALDQFLEGLVDDGLPLDAIVRIGSRSKSERLEPRSLNALKHDAAHSRQERQRFGMLRSECRAIEEEYLEGFVAASTSSRSFLNWLQYNRSSEYAEIVGLEDEEGFQAQGQRGRDKKQRWRAWEQGERRDVGLWKLPLSERQALIVEWEHEWRESTRESIHVHLDEYNEKVVEAEQVDNANLLRILRSSKVVGVTTTGCAIHQALIRALAPKIVVCEEAGEVLEAHLLACLSGATEQLIQIGDHMQLRPILNEYELSRECQSGGPRYDLDVSMFERLVDERTANANGGAGSLVTLHVQRRMRPEICDLIRRTLYPQLVDGPQVQNYPATRGFTHNLWFLDHDECEDGDVLSHTNEFEADLIVELVAYAIKQGYGLEDITILTPYLGQLVKIRGRLQAKNFRFALDEKDVDALHAAGVDNGSVGSDTDEATESKQHLPFISHNSGVVVKSLKECVRLSTVDNFQGNESLVVFISTVRCNARGSTGFLKTFNRVNVMLSRAKGAMFLLGSASTVRHSAKATMFNRVLDILEETGAMGRTLGLQCQKHGTVTQISTAQEIRELSPDGGCRVKCDQRLSCGHSCPRLCHADDTGHVAALCLEPCAKRVAVCGHLCNARCHQVCRCREIITEHVLPCGHSLHDVPCSDVHSTTFKLACRAMVEVQMPFCGHVREVSCADARTLSRAVEKGNWAAAWGVNVNCNAKCGGPQDCDHTCQYSCGQCLASNLSEPARFLASRDAMEEAAKRPRQGDHHFGSCRHACERALLCGHACTSFCHAAGQCPPCEEPCRNVCAHSTCSKKCREPCPSCADPCAWSCPHVGACELPCGSPCTRLPCDRRCTKRLQECGHQCPGLCGEPCLSRAYCRECPPDVNRTHRDQVVDHVMFATLEAHDPNESPLVQLRCGHCFTVETLDGWLGLLDFYERDESTKQWINVRPLRAPSSGDTRVKGCPTCRAPVAGVLRYGRLINFYHLHQSELKYLQDVVGAVADSRARRAEHHQNGREPISNSAARNRLIYRFRTLSKQPTPTQVVSTKECSRLARLGRSGESLNLASFRSIMQHQAVLMLGLELLALLVEKIQAWTVGTRGDFALTHTYNEGRETETKMWALARGSNAVRSAQQATLLGMELRVAWLKLGRCDDATRSDVLRELDERKRALADAPNDIQTRADQLDEAARRLGHLTKDEKDAIFRVFAKGNDAFAQGFGGRWYQCPSGHPYVITECGGAMEEATCPECGAAIGGSNHQLNATNASAEAYFTS